MAPVVQVCLLTDVYSGWVDKIGVAIICAALCCLFVCVYLCSVCARLAAAILSLYALHPPLFTTAMAIDGQSTLLQMETRGACALPGRLGCVRNGRFVFNDTVKDWGYLAAFIIYSITLPCKQPFLIPMFIAAKVTHQTPTNRYAWCPTRCQTASCGGF